jgi:hypothetical protein
VTLPKEVRFISAPASPFNETAVRRLSLCFVILAMAVKHGESMRDVQVQSPPELVVLWRVNTETHHQNCQSVALALLNKMNSNLQKWRKNVTQAIGTNVQMRSDGPSKLFYRPETENER